MRMRVGSANAEHKSASIWDTSCAKVCEIMDSPSLSSVKPDYTLGKITGISSFWLLEHLRAYFYLSLLMRITAYTSIDMIAKAAQLAQYAASPRISAFRHKAIWKSLLLRKQAAFRGVFPA